MTDPSPNARLAKLLALSYAALLDSTRGALTLPRCGEGRFGYPRAWPNPRPPSRAVCRAQGTARNQGGGSKVQGPSSPGDRCPMSIFVAESFADRLTV